MKIIGCVRLRRKRFLCIRKRNCRVSYFAFAAIVSTGKKKVLLGLQLVQIGCIFFATFP